jgi:hypothetical protein
VPSAVPSNFSPAAAADDRPAFRDREIRAYHGPARCATREEACCRRHRRGAVRSSRQAAGRSCCLSARAARPRSELLGHCRQEHRDARRSSPSHRSHLTRAEGDFDPEALRLARGPVSHESSGATSGWDSRPRASCRSPRGPVVRGAVRSAAEPKPHHPLVPQLGPCRPATRVILPETPSSHSTVSLTRSRDHEAATALSARPHLTPRHRCHCHCHVLPRAAAEHGGWTALRRSFAVMSLPTCPPQ